MTDKPWSVTLTDSETAAELALQRGRDPADENEVSELFYCEDVEVESVTLFDTKEEAMAFARQEYRSQPANWPTIIGPGTMCVFDGVDFVWEKHH